MEQYKPLLVVAMLIYGGWLAYKNGWFDVFLDGPAKSKASTDTRAPYAQQLLAVDQHLTAEGLTLEEREKRLTPLVPYMLQPNRQAANVPACRFPQEGTQ